MTRQKGSGFASVTAAAIEELLAAALRDDGDEVAVQRRLLEYECEKGNCGMSPDLIVSLLTAAVEQIALDVAGAIAQPLDGLGDVRASLQAGGSAWFEVKAQTKKDRFADLTQADWVRDETDLLRWLVHQDPQFAAQLPDWVRAALAIDDPLNYFAGWDRDSLWIADMALLTNRDVRERARISTSADLPSFLERKFIVHLTREGVRILRLALLPPISAALSGRPVDMSINYANQTAASIAFACPGPLQRGAVHFTYHLGYPTGVLGRHKLHAISLAVGPPGIEVRA